MVHLLSQPPLLVTLYLIFPNPFFVPTGRIPVLVDNTQSPPFAVMETSAELLYLLKFADKNDEFGFKDEYERSQALQWLFFWHGSGAPYQGQLNHFGKFCQEKIPCMSFSIIPQILIPALPSLHPNNDSILLRYKPLLEIPKANQPPPQTPSHASKTKHSASTAFSKSSSLENTPTSPKNI